MEVYNYFKEHGIAKAQSKFGLSRARIYQLKRMAENLDSVRATMGSLFGLSIKTYNALRREGIEDKESLKTLYSKKGACGLKKIRNIGNDAVKEITDFVFSEDIV